MLTNLDALIKRAEQKRRKRYVIQVWTLPDLTTLKDL